MQLEDYFDFEKFDSKQGVVERIRLRGHRIDLDLIVELFNAGYSPERIRHTYQTVSLEQIYAAITYYLANKEAVDKYIERGRAIEDVFYQEWLAQEPSPVVKRLRALKAAQQAEQPAS